MMIYDIWYPTWSNWHLRFDLENRPQKKLMGNRYVSLWKLPLARRFGEHGSTLERQKAQKFAHLSLRWAILTHHVETPLNIYIPSNFGGFYHPFLVKSGLFIIGFTT
jgi:hypothetical protein